MIDLKPGDKIRIKLLTESEYKKIYWKKYNYDKIWDSDYCTYSGYLDKTSKFFNKNFVFKNFTDTGNVVISDYYDFFFIEEIEKVSCLKNKIRKLKRLIIIKSLSDD